MSEPTPVLIGYFRCSVTKGRNAQWPIHVLYDERQWPTPVLRQRGLVNGHRYTRPADAEERQCRQRFRLQCYKYETLAGLLEDEARRPDCTPELLEILKHVFSDVEK